MEKVINFVTTFLGFVCWSPEFRDGNPDLSGPGLSYNNGNENDRLKFQSKRLQDYGFWKTYYFGWRDYDPELGRWFVVDPARQFASPYVAMGNNPIIGYDEDGTFAWIPFIAFTVWGGLQAAADPIMNNGNIGDIAEEFGKGAIISSVSFLTGAGMAYIAPSAQGMSPLVRYGLKAGYAALTAATTSVVATATNDFLEDGGLNSSSLKYFNAIKNSVLSSLLISGLSSLDSYLTWDRLSSEAKINTVKKELNLEKLKHKVKIVYKANVKYFGDYDRLTHPNVITIGPYALESKAILKSTFIHELKHHQDWWSLLMGKDKMLTYSLYKKDPELVQYIMERQAYLNEFNNIKYLNVPAWFYKILRHNLKVYSGNAPLIPNLNHLWFNLY